MRSSAKRREFLVGRTAIRRVLGAILEMPPAAVTLVEGPHGKPHIGATPPLQFNLSHSGDQAILAVGTAPLGVDIEQMRSGRPFTRLADRFFAAVEAQWLHAQPAASRQRAFYHLWTLKEAYLKALGTGLTLSSQSFSVDAAADPPRLLQTPPDRAAAASWNLRWLPAATGYCAALCTQAPLVEYRQVALAEITGEA
jgi:4'-phosphopantetheinyl transferase